MTSKTKNILRWIFTLPAAALAAWAAWFAVLWLNRVTFSMIGFDPDALISRAYIELVSHALMGAVFVYVG